LTTNWIHGIRIEPISGDVWILINKDIRCKKLKLEAGIMTREIETCTER